MVQKTIVAKMFDIMEKIKHELNRAVKNGILKKVDFENTNINEFVLKTLYVPPPYQQRFDFDDVPSIDISFNFGKRLDFEISEFDYFFCKINITIVHFSISLYCRKASKMIDTYDFSYVFRKTVVGYDITEFNHLDNIATRFKSANDSLTKKAGNFDNPNYSTYSTYNNCFDLIKSFFLP